MKKLFLVILCFFITGISAYSKNMQHGIGSIISYSGIPVNSVSISVKDLKTGQVIYKLNDKILMHPASVQKLLTIVPIMDVLGEDYKLKTELYSRGKDGYLIKLGADPYLTSSDIGTLVDKINIEAVSKIYIDDSIIEPKDWGEGWQWDDDLNVLMPHFNSYNLDGNVTKYTLAPTEAGKPVQIINTSKSPFVILNNVITGNKNAVSVSRDNAAAPNILKMDGTVQTKLVQVIPNNNLKWYFNYKLRNILEEHKIYLKEAYAISKKSGADKKISEVTHGVDLAVDDILKNSSNMTAETLSKLAAAKLYNKQGSDIDGVKLFYDYCDRMGINRSEVRVVDASGVSKNNLMNADFITEFLIKSQEKPVLTKMCVPGTGTLASRMVHLKNNLRAKTGTLSDTSGIAGFLTAKSGREYAFSIMISTPSSSSSDKKMLENYIIRELYLDY